MAADLPGFCAGESWRGCGAACHRRKAVVCGSMQCAPALPDVGRCCSRRLFRRSQRKARCFGARGSQRAEGCSSSSAPGSPLGGGHTRAAPSRAQVVDPVCCSQAGPAGLQLTARRVFRRHLSRGRIYLRWIYVAGRSSTDEIKGSETRERRRGPSVLNAPPKTCCHRHRPNGLRRTRAGSIWSLKSPM